MPSPNPIIQRNEMFIYVIIHPKFDGWVKVGRTIHPGRRLINYNNCCPYKSFVMVYCKCFNILKACLIEKYFDDMYRSNKNEWYKTSIDNAITTIARIDMGVEDDKITKETRIKKRVGKIGSAIETYEYKE